MADGAGALLVRSGLIGTNQLASAQTARTEQGGTIGEHLVLGELADDEQLTSFYHSRLMVPRIDPNLLARIPRRIIAKIPADMAAEFRVVPVQLDRDQNLTLAMSDPSDTHAIDEIGFFTGCYVMRAVATQRQIAWCLAHYYGFVTPLGETLLQPTPEAAEAASGPDVSPADGVPKPRRGPGPVTREVEASRHRVIPPAADDEPDDDTGPMEIIAEPPAAVVQRESGPTGPLRRRPNQEPNPPELDPRAGEVEVRGEDEAVPSSSRQDLPAVVVEPEPEPAPAIEEDDDDSPIATIEETDEDEVVILDRPSRASSQPPVEVVEETPPDDDDDAPVVVLDKPKAKRRAHRPTQVGLGIEPAMPRRKPPVGTAVGSDAEAAAEAAASDDQSAVPVAVEDQTTEANPTGRFEKVTYDEEGWGEADEFGPPGTTIPPPYLGAMPDTESTGPHNAIPLNVPSDESGAVSVPIERSADPVVNLADDMSEAADSQRELEESAMRLVETLRALDHATTRDAIVEILLDHLSKSFERATFFVNRGGKLAPFRSKGSGRMAANWKNTSMNLTNPSTLRDVVQSRLPFRGHLPDAASQGFVSKVFGAVPDEILLVPCAVRDRPVGVLCGTGRTHRIFHEHLSVVTRGAGEAFERILKARKS